MLLRLVFTLILLACAGLMSVSGCGSQLRVQDTPILPPYTLDLYVFDQRGWPVSGAIVLATLGGQSAMQMTNHAGYVRFHTAGPTWIEVHVPGCYVKPRYVLPGEYRFTAYQLSKVEE